MASPEDITAEARRLSQMLFRAREDIEMWADVIENETGRPAGEPRTLVAEIDQYRADRGWSPDGFGGELT